MPHIPTLLPFPRSLKLLGGSCPLNDKKMILLQDSHPQSLLFTALQLKSALDKTCQLVTEIYAGHSPNSENTGITLRLDEQSTIKPQGYLLKIMPEGIILEAKDPPGLFYGYCTLIQIFQYYSPPYSQSSETPPVSIPCLEIEDWPEFRYRGVMLDISRDKVPTMETVFDLVDMLASWKINQLQLYTEHTFAYQQHPEVWADASPFTGEEIMKLDAFCRERYIELVPNQNSFGYLEHWLRLPRYKPLAEAPEGFDFPWGHHEGPFSLCPLDKGSLSLLMSLYDELLPHFTSRQFNVGCDETFDLGQGRSKAECERVGSGRVYLDFLLKIYTEVKKRGFRMQFWGDIIMAHPELVPELPKDSIALEWGYEADHPFDEHACKFAQAGLSFYVCPGTSAWNSLGGRTDNCLENLANAAQNGLKHGADGYLITDWGDNGHWQVLPISYLGFAAGAAYAWCFHTNQDMDVRKVLSHYAFQDLSGSMANVAYDLGNVYRAVGVEPPNTSVLFQVLQRPFIVWKEYLEKEAALPAFHHTLALIDQVSQNYARSSSLRSDNDLLQREFIQTIALLRHACMRGLFGYGSGEYSKKYLLDDMDKIVNEYQSIWLKRNRTGGLRDSLSYFEKARKEYL